MARPPRRDFTGAVADCYAIMGRLENPHMRVGYLSLFATFYQFAFVFFGIGRVLGQPTPSSENEAAVPTQPTSPAPENFSPRPAVSWLDGQIALARRGFSGGSIDGLSGPQSEAALRAFQRSAHLPETGQLDPATGAQLLLLSPPLQKVVLSKEVLERLQPLSTTWLGKSQQTSLDYETVLEWAAEQSHAHPGLIRRLNPDLDWTQIPPGTRLTVPAVGRVTGLAKAASLHLQLGVHVLEACDETGNVIAHFPVSIAHNVEKRLEGELHITVVIPNPDYTFDPEIFPESAEGRELGRKLIIPPGPNNPVGVAWIGLDHPGYGIHGTPTPEMVGRTESHGCFRLANWDALSLLDLVWVGLPVLVDP